MANRARGEVTVASLDGRTWRLCLTLGALAEIEDGFAARGLDEIISAMTNLRAKHLQMVLLALLHGGGHRELDAAAVADLAFDLNELPLAIGRAMNPSMEAPAQGNA